MNGLTRFRTSLFLTLGLLATNLSGQGEPGALSDDAALRDFTSWQELTNGPHKVVPGVWALCVPPSPAQLEHPGEVLGRGTDRFIRVYANPRAVPLMREPRGPKYPVGSRIAKMKLLPGGTRPVSVAFMVKREAGFNPASLDWEFLFFEGDPLRRSTGSLSNCQKCHGNLTAGDGVYGSYLSEPRHQG